MNVTTAPIIRSTAPFLFTGYTVDELRESEIRLRAALTHPHTAGLPCEACGDEVLVSSLTTDQTLWRLALVPSGADDVPIMAVLRRDDGWTLGDDKAHVALCPLHSTAPAIVFGERVRELQIGY